MNRFRSVAFATSIACLVAVDAAHSAVVYVDASATGIGDGSSWTDAYTELRDALPNSSSGDEVWVAAGTYTPPPNEGDSFLIPGGVSVYGGFVGGEIALSERDHVANPTILSGEIGTPELDDNIRNIVLITGQASVALDGFVITRGDGSSGCGVLVEDGSVARLDNLVFTDNHASTQGAGLEVGDNSSTTMTNVRFVDNHSNSKGGAVYVKNASSNVWTGLYFDANTSNEGGAFFIESSEVRISEVEFVNNVANSRGGAIRGRSGSVLTLVNALYWNNSADDGGALYIEGGDCSLVHATIAGNQAINEGGGIGKNSSADLEIVNSIIWSNTAPTDPNIMRRPPLDALHSLIEGSGGSSNWDVTLGIDLGGNLDVDPLFVDQVGGDLALTLYSPALDAGTDVGVTLPIIDLAGNPREVRDPDMGALEDQSQLTDLAMGLDVEDLAPAAGDTFVYSAIVENLGPDAAGQVEATLTLPPLFPVVGHVASQGVYSDASGSWNVGSIAAAQAETLAVRVVMVDEGSGLPLVATATAASLGAGDFDPSPDNDTAEVALPSPSSVPLTPDLLMRTIGSTGPVSVAAIGDVDDDGFDDLLVGSSSNETSWVYFGGPDADNLPDLSLTATVGSESYGYSVAATGDVNGDGYPDFAVSAAGQTIPSPTSGRIYVYFGGPGLDDVADWIVVPSGGDQVRSVSSAGDFDGDGYADLLVADDRNSSIASNAGRVAVYFGGMSPDNTPDLVLDGEGSGALFGESLAFAGDVNDDDQDDFIVGSPGYTGAGAASGRAYVYFGGPGADAIADVVISGSEEADRLGDAVAGGLDVSGDLISDVVIGGPGLGPNDEGQAQVLFGGTVFDKVPDVVLTGEAAFDRFGDTVALVPSLDGDATGEILVSAREYDTAEAAPCDSGFGVGKLYVYVGGIALDTLPDFELEGEIQVFNTFPSVGSAGDFDADGSNDFFLALSSYSFPTHVHVFGNTSDPATFGWTPRVDWTDATPSGLIGGGTDEGAAWIDIDSDRDLDLYILTSDDNLLFRQDGPTSFTDITTPPLNDPSNSYGVATGDYDNDGDVDLYVTNDGAANLLVRNDIDGVTDATSGPLGNAGTSRSAGWFDYDGDGDLDLYVVNRSSSNLLLRNDGPSGFVDATPPALVGGETSYAVAMGDYDDDGDLDLYLTGGAGTSNQLVRNDGGGVFTDVTTPPLDTTAETLGAAWGDYDNDGDLDLYAAERLFRNDGAGSFVDVQFYPLERFDVGQFASVSWLDYDNDGDLDMHISDGLTSYLGGRSTGRGSVYNDRLLRNDGDVGFTEDSACWENGSSLAAWGDYDADGDLDAYVSTRFGSNYFLRNDQSTGNHWLHLDLVGTSSNRSAIGARVRVVSGALSQIRDVVGAEGYLEQNSSTVEFGLGQAVSADSVVVRWPSGRADVWLDVSADQRITLNESAPNEAFYEAMSWTTTGFSQVNLPRATTEPLVASPLGETGRLTLAEALESGQIYVGSGPPGLESIATLDLETGAVLRQRLIAYPDHTAAVDSLGAIATNPLQGTVLVTYVAGATEYLGRLNPVTGGISAYRPLQYETVTDPGPIDALVVSSTGTVIGIESESTLPGMRLWKIDTVSSSASLIANVASQRMGFDDAAFVGPELWLVKSSTRDAVHVDLVGSPGAVLAERRIGEAGFRGLAARSCIDSDTPLVARDAPADAGGAVSLDWTDYSPPPGLLRYEIVRGVSSCALDDPGLAAIDSLPPGATTYEDSVDDYKAYYYGVRVITGSKADVVGDVLLAGPVVASPNLVINEFAPSGGFPRYAGPGRAVGEFVEIRNLGPDTVSLDGYRLTNGIDVEVLAGPIGGNDYFVAELDTINLDDEGGTITFLAPVDSGGAVIDEVSYGSEGGAPTVPVGSTVSRVNGTGATDPDATSFAASEATPDADNLAAQANLGGSIVINEVFFAGPGGADYVELINPLGSRINLTDLAISDGPAFTDTLLGVELDAGELFVLGSGSPEPFTRDLVRDQLYLYQITETGLLQLIDQIGWGAASGDLAPPVPVDPDTALVRVPDGAALYLDEGGTNWLDSGGGRTLFYGLRTPGNPNVISTDAVITVEASGESPLADALAEATPGATVVIPPGAYAESVVIPEAVTVTGASDSGEVVIEGDGTSVAVTVVGFDENTRLSNVTLTSPTGGMLINGNVVVSSVRFRRNSVSGSGAAVVVQGGRPTFDGCVFEGNEAGEDGGAVLVQGGSPTFEYSIFVRNTAAGRGGVLHQLDGFTEFTHCVLDRNGTYGLSAGEVHAMGGFVSLTYSTVTSSIKGAPMRAEDSSQMYFGCGLIHGNSAPMPTGDTGLSIGLISQDDPQFCQPLALNYSYPNESALDLLGKAATCVETSDEGEIIGVQIIGVAGPPCATSSTDSPSPLTVPRDRLALPTPNPFNPQTRLQFELSQPGVVDLEIFDVRGRLVDRLIRSERYEAGRHEVVWSGTDRRGESVASGVYFLRLKRDGRVVGASRRAVMIK